MPIRVKRQKFGDGQKLISKAQTVFGGAFLKVSLSQNEILVSSNLPKSGPFLTDFCPSL
jgi:hypothetical protein